MRIACRVPFHHAQRAAINSAACCCWRHGLLRRHLRRCAAAHHARMRRAHVGSCCTHAYARVSATSFASNKRAVALRRHNIGIARAHKHNARVIDFSSTHRAANAARHQRRRDAHRCAPALSLFLAVYLFCALSTLRAAAGCAQRTANVTRCSVKHITVTWPLRARVRQRTAHSACGIAAMTVVARIRQRWTTTATSACWRLARPLGAGS